MAPSRITALILGAAALVFNPVFSPERAHAAFQTDTSLAGTMPHPGNMKSDDAPRDEAEFQVASNELSIFNKRAARKQLRSINGFLNSVFSDKPRKVRRSSRNAGSHRLSGPERATLANVNVTPQPSPLTQAKGLRSKLGNLVSLERDYQDYLDSDDPNLAAIQAYIGATLHYERVAGGLTRLEGELTAAREVLTEPLEGISAHDGYAYKVAASEQLVARLAALDAVDISALPVEQGRLLETERLKLKTVLESEDFTAFKTAETAYLDSQVVLATLRGEISDETLSEALIAMADQDLVEEYGDAYVDAAMLDWVKQVLGVGAYDGKIDEIRHEMANGHGAVKPVVPDVSLSEELPPHRI